MFPLRDTKTSGRFPTITVLLILTNVLIFFLELFTPDIETFIAQYALIPRFISLTNIGMLKTFITAMFLHGGFLHIVSNMWFLWIFGDNVEEKIGVFYLPLYLSGGILGNLIQFTSSPQSAIPILGASGAIAAILGAYLVLFPKHKVKTLVPIFGFFTIIELPAFLMLFYWFFMQIFNGAASIVTNAAALGGVAWFAHAGGFLSGLVFARPFKSK